MCIRDSADALTWHPEAPFDAILLDAPCTATGTARRHPDVLHRVGPRQIAEMAEVQARLLERARGWLAPGGRTARWALAEFRRLAPNRSRDASQTRRTGRILRRPVR